MWGRPMGRPGWESTVRRGSWELHVCQELIIVKRSYEVVSETIMAIIHQKSLGLTLQGQSVELRRSLLNRL